MKLRCRASVGIALYSVREFVCLRACGTPVQAANVLFSGFVRVLENLESHGISIFQNPGLEILENQF
jgi:hypothetical protein